MLERDLFNQGYRRIFGLDEVGRGPMAGPLVAAAVCLPVAHDELRDVLKGVKDSKQMTHRQREAAVEIIEEVALAWGIGAVAAQEMAHVGNMTAVTMEAMRRALEDAQQRSGIEADYLLVDYYRVPFFDPHKQNGIKQGDTLSLTIAAASVLAKVHRDTLMMAYADEYPAYGFESHKGYPTPQHLEALQKHGATPIHRPNYAPVQKLLSAQD